MATRAHRFALGACVAATLLVTAPGAFASHFSYPATYTGTVSGGGTLDFDVGQAMTVTRFAVTNVATECGTFTTTFTGNAAITNDSFSQPNPPLSFSGSFPADQQAIGTLGLKSFVPSCTTAPISWTASTTVAPPAPTTTPAPDQIQPQPLLPKAVSVATRRVEGLSVLLKRGLRVGLACPSGCTATSTIELTRSSARRIGIAAAAVSLGKATARIPGAGEIIYSVKVGSAQRQALKRVKGIVLTLRTKVVQAGAATVTSTKKVGITRATPANHKPVLAAGHRTNVNTDFDYDDAGRLTGGVTTVTLASPATDADGDPLTYTWTASSGRVTAVGRSAGWERLADAGQLAAGTLTLTVSDGRGGQASATFDFARGAG